METPESELAAEFGGPGPEDFANGAAALAAGLVREAQALSASAAALRAAATGGEAISDVRRARVVLAAAGEAALRAALAIDAATMLADDRPAADHARRIAEAAKRVGLPATTLSPLLRAAALDFRTDDAAARIAASTLAADLCALLNQEP